MTVDGLATTPAGRRIQLGSLLRQLRHRSGLTQEDVGSRVWPDKKLATTQNKITRLESGDGGIELRDLEALLAVYGVDDPAKVAVVRDLIAATSQRGRWRGTRAAHAEHDRKFVDLTEDAVIVRETAVEEVPVLLQCEAYMRASQSSSAAAAIAAQRQHQELVLEANAAQVYAMLSESCVRRVRGSTAVMREQVDHLITLSGRPNVHIHLIPFAATARLPIRFECFTLLRLACPQLFGDFTEYVDLPFVRMAGEPVYAPARADAFQRLWVAVADVALNTARTRHFLRAIARELG
ncbi:MAG TPA: Scr1 family TA system antitoxin-like transcriptional regulator [Amycolatopsis sp.]|nr:Scr1 family TA system antitoxin-like transcriptional regulator [Amycolatopsis sp.]